MKCYKIDQFFHGYQRCCLLLSPDPETRFQLSGDRRARALGSRSCVRSRAKGSEQEITSAFRSARTRNGRIVKPSFAWSRTRGFSVDLTKIHCSEPLGLSPPILESSMNAPAKKKKERKNNAEKRDTYVYILRRLELVESASQKAQSPPLAPPRLLCPSPPHPARDM